VGVIAENLARIEERIGAACARAGRAQAEITLIGVSKTHPAGAILEAYEAGVRHFGENRVQEWEGKRGEVLSGGELSGAVWHLIGHLQSNKAGRAAKIFDCVDSVDDFGVAERLRRGWVEGRCGWVAAGSGGAGADRGGVGAARGVERVGNAGVGDDVRPKLRVLIEVRVAEEETKSGVAIGELEGLAERIAGIEEMELAGLMCIPPFFEEAELARGFFSKLRETRDSLAARLGKALPVLSMGMSHDFGVAIEEGATEVRVGTALFGSRAPQMTK
jgi:PLP dependent protein